MLLHGDHLFKEYLNNPNATAETLPDGWLPTGDLGALDEDGYLPITGRKKEILVTSGGKNVAPALLEDRSAPTRWSPSASSSATTGPTWPRSSPSTRSSWAAGASTGSRPGRRRCRCGRTRICSRRSRTRSTTRNAAVSKAESVRKFRVLGAPVHRGLGALDAFAEAQVECRRQGLRGRDRGDLRQLARGAWWRCPLLTAGGCRFVVAGRAVPRALGALSYSSVLKCSASRSSAISPPPRSCPARPSCGAVAGRRGGW
ncbi:2-succinylbenzoate--CoA ligase [Streptomyces tendae]